MFDTVTSFELLSAIEEVTELPRRARRLFSPKSLIATTTVARISEAVTSYVCYHILCFDGSVDQPTMNHTTYCHYCLCNTTSEVHFRILVWSGCLYHRHTSMPPEGDNCLWYMPPFALVRPLISPLGSILIGRFSSSTIHLYIHQICGSVGVGTIVSTVLYT